MQLRDQFTTDEIMIGKLTNVCLPVELGNMSVDPSAYLTCYQLKRTSGATIDGSRTTIITNQLGARQALAVENAGVLCVPSLKVKP